jgi:O-antigen ligase
MQNSAPIVSGGGSMLGNITGFLMAFKSCLTYLFFRGDPQLGSAFRIALTLAWLLVIVGYTIMNPPVESTRSAGRPLRWIALYLSLAGVSLLWTTGGSLMAAVGYWASLVADVAAVYVLLLHEPVRENAYRMMRGFVSGAVVVAIIAWSAPAMADMRLGNEEFLHPNLIGFYFAIGTLMAAFLAERNKSWLWVSIGLAMTMLRTLSKATIAAFAFAGGYYLLRGLKVGRTAKMWIGIGCSMVLFAFWGLMEAYFDLYSQGSNVETLTGRTYIWSRGLEFSMEKPWFGHGFDSFRWIFPPFDGFLPHHAHNELVQQLFTYGLVGLFVAGATYISFYRQVRSHRESRLRGLAMSVLVLVLIRGLVETDQFDLCFPLWMMSMFSIALSTTAPAAECR